MNESIQSKLEASRKELLDLGLRNPLLNYKTPASKGLHFVQEKSDCIYDILVNQGKAMTFLGRPSKDENENLEFEEPTDIELQTGYNDSKLQTNETEIVLQRKLLNTYYAARTSIEEQGVNILFISLGMLHWYESDNSDIEILAPIVLIPVLIERSSARERFRVKYSLEEIGINISLQAKMKNDFGIKIPDFPENEEFSIEDYYKNIKTEIKDHSKWHLEIDEIELGFFSFAKFMIYTDLDINKWPQNTNPLSHSVLNSLFGDGFKDEQPTLPADAFIDNDSNAHELFQVVDADSSQILAMLAIREGKNLIIQGPPGTGKSQTITNIIADAIGKGKKVLFVAEKMAALEVVKRRLDNIGLGEPCLELHSNKANKRVLHQELRRILELGKPSVEKLQQEVSLLESYKEELNNYCFAVNSVIGLSNLTTYKVIGYLVGIYKEIGNVTIPKLPLPDLDNCDPEKIARAEAIAERIQSRLKDIGIPSKLLFWGSNLKVLLRGEQEIILMLLREVKSSAETLKSNIDEICSQMLLSTPSNYIETQKFIDFLDLASKQPNLNQIDVQNKAWISKEKDLIELFSAGVRLNQLYNKYENILSAEAWSYDVSNIKVVLIQYGDKRLRYFNKSYRKEIKVLSSLCNKEPLPKENAKRIQFLNDILETQKLCKFIDGFKTLGIELLRERWKRTETNWEDFKSTFYYLFEIHKKIIEGKYKTEFLDYLSRNENSNKARINKETIYNLLEIYSKQVNELFNKINYDDKKQFGEGFLNIPYEKQISNLSSWIEKLPEIQSVISWNNLTDTAYQEGFNSLIEISNVWEYSQQYLKLAIQKTWYEYLLEKSFTLFPALCKFERMTHEEVVRQFKDLDMLNFHYNRARVAQEHWKKMPKLDAGGQVNVLRNEFNKRARHKPIRKLIQEAGMAIQAIKPVFMMSPISIANFLPPGAIEFDMVIFDEASQVKPVEALGAILRGKQLIVVGDTKQLPPTTFFDSVITEDNDEIENITNDLQSILGMCDGKGAPQRMLRWHYRSLHESLINFSNNHFYENKLVIFPSSGSKQRMGLVYHHLPDTIYDRGKTRKNIKEAEKVADAVLEHARRNSKLTLGVVAFGNSQRLAIQDALENRRRMNPDVESFFNSHKDEPFFIKNLENVQGDERDIIFISVGFGRTEEGFVSMFFGPINNDGGERRLNVLITRARFRCEVFTNLSSDDIDTSRTKSVGVRILKEFLYFAEHGKFKMIEETGFPSDSPFEEEVAEELSKLNYIIRKQVGSEGFHIDLAIVDPNNPGRYLLGIECDGASYHSARSARDRDRLRQQILENIGWKIHRVWSTDWFRNPEKELKRIVEAVEKAKEIIEIDDEQDEVEKNEEVTIYREENIPLSKGTLLYKVAVVSSEITSIDLQYQSTGKIATCIENIVTIEGPIHFDELARRITEAAGCNRVGPRIKEAISQAVKYSSKHGNIKVNGDFIWLKNMQKPEARNRSILPNSARKFKYIAPEEIETALEKVIRESIAILPEGTFPFIAKIFGFSRATDEMKNDILKAIEKCCSKKILYKDGDYLKIYAEKII